MTDVDRARRRRTFTASALLATFIACGPEVAPSPSSDSAVPDTNISSADVPSSEPSEPTVPPGPPAGAEPSAVPLTPDGWGPLRIGMSRAEVVAAAGEDANPGAVGGPDPERCDEFRPANAPAGLLVMIERGILTRISVSGNAGIETPAGFHVGDPGSRVIAEFGSRARVEPHQYRDAPARYITVWRQAPSGADRRGIRYETDAAGKIVHIRAGGPSIEYVEGCL